MNARKPTPSGSVVRSLFHTFVVDGFAPARHPSGRSVVRIHHELPEGRAHTISITPEAAEEFAGVLIAAATKARQ